MIDIIVLNYNGANILPLCLPSIVEAAKRSPLPCHVIVLDNKSTDNGLEYVKKTFPQVKIVIASENRVLFSYNELVRQLDSDVVILLNNDVKVEPGFIAPLVRHFDGNKVFASSPKQLDFNGNYNGGKNRLAFHFGLMEAGPYPYRNNDPVIDKLGFTYYEANSAYDRKKFVELGGFDDIYAPFTWEDSDLGYRAWKEGYMFIYEPKSLIHHYESYTFDQEIKKIRSRRVISRRNSFIFTWKNITDIKLISLHIMLLPLNLLLGVFYDWARIAAFFEALRFLPRIYAARKKAVNKINDAEIFRGL